MNDVHYPQNVEITLQDFEASGWKEAVDLALSESYVMMYHSLAEAAHTANEQNQIKTEKVLSLLAGACSMVLSPLSPNEPFIPAMAIHNCRTILPDDLLETDIQFFTEIAESIDHSRLKARINDLLWLKSTPRNTRYALNAIDAYCSLPLDANTWVNGGEENWQRAISLALALKKGAGDRLQNMEALIVSTFSTASSSDDYFALWLADLMKANRLGKAHQLDVARKLESLAQEFSSENNLLRARDYYDAASEWYKWIPDEAKAAEMTVAVAESWADEASIRNTAETPSCMVAVKCYDNAIQTYRTIPRKMRPVHRVDERIDELLFLLSDAGKGILDQMQIIQTSSIDLNELIEIANQSVTGKTVQEALYEFANVYTGVRVDQLRDTVIQRMRQQPLFSFFPSVMVSSDGRVTARREGLSLKEGLTPEDEIAIRAEMIRNYQYAIQIAVQGCILPALEVLLQEHRIREADFIALAKASNFVPLDRVNLFGKALFAGYDGDFITALHLLIPQIENLVRVHLKQKGAQTSNLDKNGIETENGLSTIMELPEAIQVFGENIHFELKSLLCDANGPNLRNELAHGLLDEDKCNSSFVVYVWWLALRLTVLTWWNSANNFNRQYEEAEVNTEQTTTTEPIAEGEP